MIGIYYRKLLLKLFPDKCPFCKIPFSDYFVWDGLRYCWPCYDRIGMKIMENGEMDLFTVRQL